MKENDILFAFGIGAAVFMAIFIGANDIANAMGPLIGSKSMKLYKVLLLAAVFELIGSVLLGGFVSNTVSNKLIHIPNDPSSGGSGSASISLFLSSMVSVLIGSGGWLCIATLLSLPVSTTHSVIGSVVGVGVFMSGWKSVDWRSLLNIVITWVTSPLIGGITSMILWYCVKRFVMLMTNTTTTATTTITTTTTTTGGGGSGSGGEIDNDDDVDVETNGGDQMNQMRQLQEEAKEDRAIARMVFLLPLFSFATVGVLLLFIVYKGLTPFNLQVPFYIALPVSVALSAIFGAVIHFVLVPRVKKQLNDYQVSSSFSSSSAELVAAAEETSQEMNQFQLYDHDHDDENESTKRNHHEIEIHPTMTDDSSNDQVPSYVISSTTATNVVASPASPSNKQDDDNVVVDLDQEERVDTVEQKGETGTEYMDSEQQQQQEQEEKLTRMDVAEKYVFQFLVVMTSACIAVAHGANDISNASGPLTAIYYTYSTGKFPDENANTKVWITLVTAVGLVFGLATLGHKVMQTIGTKITKLTPARAFVSQLSTATITLSASLLGLPLSTTHIVVGCIYGIGIVDDYRNLKWRLIAGIIASWLITIPGAAILTLGVFAFFRIIV